MRPARAGDGLVELLLVRWLAALEPLAFAPPLLVAQADPTQTFLNAGVLGAIVVGFILGLVVPKTTHDRALTERDAERARVDTLVELNSTRVIPLLERALDVLRTNEAETAQTREALIRNSAALERLEAWMNSPAARGRRT